MRKIFIGDINGKAKECKEFLQRNSEDRLIFGVISNQSLVESQVSSDDHTRLKMPYLVPFMNQYQGIVMFVESTCESKIDVDSFFSYHAFQNLGPRVYFIKHNIWIIDCGHESNATLNPFYLDQNDPYTIKENFPFDIIDSI